MANGEPLLIGDAARLLGCRPWQLRRLVDRGLIDPPDRLGGRYRVYYRSDLPRLRQALAKAGYLSAESETLATAQ